MTPQNEAQFLGNISLDGHEWRGLNKLADSLSDFEPLAKRSHLGPVVAERLVALGLAEKGPCLEQYFGGDEVGYRLNELGWKFLDRGRWPKGG
jgi:hypothetical protein